MRSPNTPCCHFVRSGRGLKPIELPPDNNRSSHGDPENLPRSGVLSGVVARLTSAAGDAGASQRVVQRTVLSHRVLNHFQISLSAFEPPGMF